LKRNFVNPFKARGKWYKGNVHAHTTVSDGTRTPETLVDIYREAGYDFLSITDHSIVADTTGLGGSGFLLIPGEEICIGRSHAGTLYHIVALGVEETLPFTDFDRELDPQLVVDHINEVGGIPILAHPYWSGLNHRDMIALERYHGVEIYNTSCDYERNTGLSAAHIDDIIVAGRRPWIYAVDDHHGADRPNLPLDACGAWINVKAPSLIGIDGDGVISVECSPVKTISFVSTPSLGMKFYAEDTPLTHASYPGRPGETYVRVEVTDIMGRTAWSNPMYNET
jgi:hypothetical protein